jgi:two-component system CheB/CheR fusion protein
MSEQTKSVEVDDKRSYEFEALLEYLKTYRGFDFTGYKRSSLVRRVDKRMQMLGIVDYTEYMDYLEVHQNEFEHLFNTILINVTAFFRDPQSWEYLAQDVVPQILGHKKPDEPIRIWSAGCASGEEAYTLAMILASALGIEQFKERVKIYATDIDDDALSYARMASYTPREVVGIPQHLIDTYFELSSGRYTFNKDLRRGVIFGRHDLIQDAPISRIDLLVCRNILMYFNAEVQTKILSRLHFALNEGGFMFLGKAEMLFTQTNLFGPVDLKRRIFTKVSKGNFRHRPLIVVPPEVDSVGNYVSNIVRVRELVFDFGPIAQLVVDTTGSMILANDRANSLFRLTTHDTGRPIQDLEVSYRPAELRSCIEQATAEKRPIALKEVPWLQQTGETTYWDVQIIPLPDKTGELLGTSICFTDVTRYKHLQDELESANREVETAYEELQSTNEELETTNEELQSSVEELQTTNEELQSTNEELETMNEELQSTNEEMQTVNDELRQRSTELNEVNSFLASILRSLQGGVVVLNRDLQIQIWNHKTEDLWGLRSEEVIGKHFLNLDIGLPVDLLRTAIRNCLAGEDRQTIIVDAVNRRGKTIHCKVTCSALVGVANNVTGVILLMEEADHVFNPGNEHD